ncbi:MAG: sulfite exporter TauE/SafE family protein [Planctomycetota bacterium]
MTTLLVAVLVASLLGSLHCAGMCGGLVCLCVGGAGDRGRALPHVAYHGGRLVAYTTLGAASGALGGAIDLGGPVVGVVRPAALAAGAIVILVGGLALVRGGAAGLKCLRLPARLERAFQRGLRAAAELPPTRRALIIGLLTALLPCGWLYAFAITAAGTGHALVGAATMATFWVGTVPVLAVLGLGADRLAAPLRRHVPTVTAVAILAIGVATVVGRVRIPAPTSAAAASASFERGDLAAAAASVPSHHGTDLPCCDDHAAP